MKESIRRGWKTFGRKITIHTIRINGKSFSFTITAEDVEWIQRWGQQRPAENIPTEETIREYCNEIGYTIPELEKYEIREFFL